MPFPFDKYPWINFHELNLAYFIVHFREIFEQWDQLYHDLLSWKNATDADLAEWKSTVEAGITSWETGLQQSMEDWKDQTETDISAWETSTLSALDAWKTATTTVFEQIRTEAAANAQAAAGSATAAQTALAGAQTAQAAAEAAAAGIQSELTQIQTNTADIADSKVLSNDRWDALTSDSEANPDDFYISGTIRATDGVVISGTNRLTNTVKIKSTSILEIKVNEGYAYYLYAWDGNTYLGGYRDGIFEKTPGSELLTSHIIAKYPATYSFLINLKRIDNADINTSEAENIIYVRNALGPDTTLTKQGEAADAKATGDAINKVNEQADKRWNILTTEIEANPDDFYISGTIRAADGVVSHGTNRLTNTVKIKSTSILEIKVNEGYAYYLYAWDGDTYLGGYRDGIFEKTPGSELLTSHIIAKYPATYSFLINLKRIDNADINTSEAENIIYVRNALSLDIDKVSLAIIGLHEVPESQGVLNCIKRARQMTDIEWIPAVDLPRVCRVMGNDYRHNQTYEDVFKAGVKYKGIPYSNSYNNTNAGYRQKYVGFEVGIETFITAIENENSVIAKESYFDGTKMHATIYGLVCSALVSYAIGLQEAKLTNTLPSVNGMSQIGKMIDNGVRYDLSTLKLCDIFDIPGDHCVIITDIIRNEDGSIKFIEISEETIGGNGNPNNKGGQNGGLCRRRGYTPDEIYEYYGNYNIYRYSYLYRVTYTPSDYVNTGNELDMFRFNSLPCMPYMGEKAVYNSSDLRGTNILINCPGYDYLRVFKDGTEIAGSPFGLNESTIEVDTGFSAIGNYEAYLSKYTSGAESGTTLHCHWSVE